MITSQTYINTFASLVLMDNGLNQNTINTLWMQNIYDNLKNLEMLERLAREGCTSLLDYLQIPHQNRNIVIGDAQFKNLRFMVTELHLLLTDLTPVMEETKITNMRGGLAKVQKSISTRSLFINDRRSATNNNIATSEPTDLFNMTLDYLATMRISIIKEISPILYVRAGEETKGKKWENHKA